MSATTELGDLSHLHQSAQAVARLPGEERLRHERADRWIGYTRASEALIRLETLREVGVRMLVIDELHNVPAGRGDSRREFLNLIRFLGNELRAPLAGVGTREAYLAIRSDDQLENRFEPFILPRWQAGGEASSLLASFAAAFPLRRASPIARPEMADYLLTQDGFDTYVRQHSVLLTRGAIPPYRVAPRWRPWIPDRPTARSARRVCPVCARSPDRGMHLLAGLPLMISCAEHGCRLKPEGDVAVAGLAGEQAPPDPVSGAVAAMDRRTDEGLRSGTVTLPGRPVHVGVWFRLLRTLINELTVPLSNLGSRPRAAVEEVWRATGRPVRAGLNLWRPYEQLDWERHEPLLEAAATAMQLAEAGAITARGTLGPLLTPERHPAVYDGDPPSQRDLELRRARQEIDAAIDAARTDPAAALHVLRMFTSGLHTVEAFDRDRKFLIGIGIPPDFLPGPRGLGRADLVPADQA